MRAQFLDGRGKMIANRSLRQHESCCDPQQPGTGERDCENLAFSRSQRIVSFEERCQRDPGEVKFIVIRA